MLENGDINKTTRTISCRVKELKAGDMFGHEDIFRGEKRTSKVI